VDVKSFEMDTYFKKDIYSIKYEKMATSTSFSFFIKNKREFMEFFEKVRQHMAKCKSDDSCFYSVIDREIDLQEYQVLEF
jgi:hypothetical protein